MSYHDVEPDTDAGTLGKRIYLEALAGRRGFREDQIGIFDELIWWEIFEHIGAVALAGMIDAEELQRMVLSEIAAAGSQKAWADRHGLSPAYVNDLVHKRRDPGGSVLDALGLERVVWYRRRS